MYNRDIPRLIRNQQIAGSIPANSSRIYKCKISSPNSVFFSVITWKYPCPTAVESQFLDSQIRAFVSH